jgi:hypothetical protein
MATYYVDFVNGLDANNGLGPDASHASNKPWKTITKLLGAAGMASGDTAYLSPAGPFRELVTVAMTSAVAETQILGDPSNARGFKTSGGVLVSPGPVIWTPYTTNDSTAPTAGNLLTLAGRNFLTFKYIQFVAGDSTAIISASVTTNVTITDCAFFAGYKGQQGFIDVTCAFNSNLQWTIDRCFFLGGSGSFKIIVRPASSGSGADWDLNFLVRNCRFVGGRASYDLSIATSGGLTFKPGGFRARNNTHIGQGAMTTTAACSHTIPCTVANSFVYSGEQNAYAAASSGDIVEDYNLNVTNQTPSNVAAGANSKIDGSRSPLFWFGQEQVWGMVQRPFGEPMPGSPLLGFGNDTNQTATDIRGVGHIRPAGGASASAGAGAFERSNSWTQSTSVKRTGSNAIQITGPGYQEFYVPVNAASTVIAVYFQYDATYAGTRPQIQIDANALIGVSAETITVGVGALSAFAQASLSAITPTAAGVVVVRLISNDTNGGGKAYADDFSVT